MRGILMIAMISMATTVPTISSAMGKKAAAQQTAAPTCSAPVVSAAPVRNVVIAPVKSQKFPLPNGIQADLAPSMGDMMIAAVNGTGAFHPTEAPSVGGVNDPCSVHLEVRTYVTAIELNLYDINLNIGYTPDTTHLTNSNVTGEANFRIGRLDMVFSIDKCSGGLCTTILTTKVDKSMLDSDYDVKVNWGQIYGGADLVQHPSFNKILTQLMSIGMGNLAKSPDLNKLPWSATVREYDAATGTLIMGAGDDARIGAGQSFVVYAVDPANGVCNLYKTVAYIKTTRVDPISSVATVEQSLDARGIKAGDLVLVKNH